jgi:hypothetical protein
MLHVEIAQDIIPSPAEFTPCFSHRLWLSCRGCMKKPVLCD